MREAIERLPVDVTDLDLVFGARVVDALMPSMDEIPDAFRCGAETKWNRLFSDWFFKGIVNLRLTAKDGVDKEKALRHIKAIMVSFEPAHEHKEAACAYLFSLWFKDAKYKACKVK